MSIGAASRLDHAQRTGEPLTICRMVHWLPWTGTGDARCLPAVITRVYDQALGAVGLEAFGGPGPHHSDQVYHVVPPVAGAWHWPAECTYLAVETP